MTIFQYFYDFIIGKSYKQVFDKIVSNSVDCDTSLRIFPIVNVIRLSGIPSFAKNLLARSMTSGKSNRATLTFYP